MADQSANTTSNNIEMSQLKSDENILPPASAAEPRVETQNSMSTDQTPTLESQKTMATCSSGVKDDDIAMLAISPNPDPQSDDDILDSVLHDLDADGIGAVPKPKKCKWISRNIQFEEGEHDDEEQDGITVVSPPPTSHGYDFFSVMRKHGKDDKSKYFPDEDLQLLNQQRLFSKAIAAIAPKPKVLPSQKENRHNTRRGLQFIDLISKVPLSKAWHITTQILAAIVFIANVVVAIYDIFREYPKFEHLTFKVINLMLCLTENAGLLLLWMILRSKWFQTKGERSVKRQQYIENILHEVLMYPLVIMAAVAFATEKMYTEPKDAFGWIQLILLIIDVIELVWTQTVRLMMTYKVFRDIYSVVNPDVPKTSGLFSWNTAGWVLCRIYLTTMGSILTFLVLAIMFILQVHQDNLVDESYKLTWRSGLILVAFILLPLYSIVVFILANAFWVMELLLRVNIRIGKDEHFNQELTKQYGVIVSDALTYTMKKVQSNEERLEEIRLTSLLKKFIYGAIEPLNAFLLVFWQIIVITALIVFAPFPDNTVLSRSLQIVFAVVLLLANGHTFIVALAADFVVVACLLGGCCYPACIAVCCRKIYTVDPEEAEDLNYFG